MSAMSPDNMSPDNISPDNMSPSNTSPNIDGVEATFWHVDDIDWTEVQRQRNADGTIAVVREK